MAERRTWSRRDVLLAGGAAALAACAPGLVGCTSSTRVATAAEQTPGIARTLDTSWERKPDGPLPAAGDEGVPLQVRLAHTSRQPTISDGALVGHLAAVPGSAVYVLQDLGRRVDRIGARFGFGPGDTSGSLGLIAFGTSADLSGHCHMAFAPDRWIAGVVSGGGVVELARGRYTSAVPTDGRPVTADVQFSGKTVWITAPDGTVTTVTDERFAGPSGVVACWEFYKNTPSGADVRLYETWAG